MNKIEHEVIPVISASFSKFLTVTRTIEAYSDEKGTDVQIIQQHGGEKAVAIRHGGKSELVLKFCTPDGADEPECVNDIILSLFKVETVQEFIAAVTDKRNQVIRYTRVDAMDDYTDIIHYNIVSCVQGKYVIWQEYETGDGTLVWGNIELNDRVIFESFADAVRELDEVHLELFLE